MDCPRKVEAIYLGATEFSASEFSSSPTTAQSAWMSTSLSAEERLRAEVRSLRNALRDLTLRVDRHEDQLSDISAQSSGLAGFGGEGEPSAISSAGETSSFSASATTQSYQVVTSAAASEEPVRVVPSWEEREGVAREIGAFLARALRGDHRGSSGREKLRYLQNRYYLIIRDKNGVVFTNPVLVVNTFAEVTQRCRHGNQWGDSVFVGVPSLREGRVAAQAGGFAWPSNRN